MSHLVWRYYWENDVDRFRRLLAPAGSQSQQTSKSPAANNIAYGSHGASPTALTSSPRIAPKSRKSSSYLGSASKPRDAGVTVGRLEINSRDHAGLTVLLRAASSVDPNARSFVSLLLEHPAIDIHVQDPESGWNALHRALYAGNISIARMLLDKESEELISHNPVSAGKVKQLIKTKDHEGNSPFDLYNSTIALRTLISNRDSEAQDSDTDSDTGDEATVHMYHALQASRKFHQAVEGDEMFVFGSNKNLSLGVGDEDDRQYPERIFLQRPDSLVSSLHRAYANGQDGYSVADSPKLEDVPNLIRSKPLVIRDVVMSKLHAAILTSDSMSNLYICGVGRGGRLGLGDENTQFRYVPVQGPFADKHVGQVALGQNHTMAVTSDGELWTWGLNTESQLGYVLPTPTRSDEDPMSLVPRQVFGTLKKEVILGAAASSQHSVCHTGSSLYCWGRNLGQLALMDADSRSLDVQNTPRKVAASLLTSPIDMISAIDTATSCLLANHTVFVFTNYGYNLVKFPIIDLFANQSLATSFNPYDPKRRDIQYIASGGQTVAAITTRGDLFTMHINKTEASQDTGSTTNPSKIKSAISAPQCIWDSRKDGVVSVDVGENGSVIICTESGAVWKRVKRTKRKQVASTVSSSGSRRNDFKFERVPYISNIVSVRSSLFGAFAAVRQDKKIMTTAIEVSPRNLWQDLAPLLSLSTFEASHTTPGKSASQKAWLAAISRDAHLQVCMEILRSPDIENDLLAWSQLVDPPAREGLYVCTNSAPEIRVPVHSWVLAGRSTILRRALSELRHQRTNPLSDCLNLQMNDSGFVVLTLQDADVYTLLNLVVYSYLDTVIPVWKYTREAPSLAYRFRQVRTELMKLASRLHMPKLEAAARLQNDVEPSLDTDLSAAIADTTFFEDGDVLLQLDGGEVVVHSQLICQRCPFFEGMFFGRSQGQWLHERQNEGDKMTVDLRHVRPETFSYVLQHCYADVGLELFDQVAKRSIDEFSELVVDVMAVANELMLDRLSEICQHLIGKFATARNISNLLNEISPCSVTKFKDAGLEYICLQLEIMLENHLLDNLDEELLQDLDGIVRENQLAQLPVARSGRAERLLHDDNPDLALDIEEERRRWVKEMAFKNSQREEEKKAASSYRARFGSFEDGVSSSPSLDKTLRVSRGPRNEPFSPTLRPRSSHVDLIFDMDEEEASGLSSPRTPTGGTSTPQPAREANRQLHSVKGKEAVESSPGLAGSPFGPGLPSPSPLPDRSLPSDIGSPLASSAKPWAATSLQVNRMDLRNIMSEASSTSALSQGLAAAQGKRIATAPRAAVKMSQKERKKQMQQQQHSEAQGVAEQKESSSQVPWEKVESGQRPAPWKVASTAPSKVSLQDAMSAEAAAAATAQLSKKPLVASEASPRAAPRRTASPDTRFPGQGRTNSSPAVPSTHGNGKRDQEKKPVVPHSKSYMQPRRQAESTLGVGMADIIGQQQREQQMVKEAVAKRSLQEIQQEQAFQEWWDQESRRAQEDEARRQARNHHMSTGRKGAAKKTKAPNKGRGREEDAVVADSRAGDAAAPAGANANTGTRGAQSKVGAHTGPARVRGGDKPGKQATTRGTVLEEARRSGGRGTRARPGNEAKS